MVYKPLALRVALVAGFRRGFAGLQIHDSRRRSRGNVGIPQGFPRGVGRVESRLLGFPCFPYPGISMACFLPNRAFSSSVELHPARLATCYSPNMSFETIHIPLLEEGTNVWRPASAERLSESIFRILGPIPEGESWAFGPGEQVVVKNHVFADGTSRLVADRLAYEESPFHEWGSAERAVGQAIELSPEPFAPATVANVHDFIAACRIRCPVPDGVAKGYWSTIRIWWKDLEIEVFDDRYEMYRFSQGATAIEYFNHTPGTEFPLDLMIKLPNVTTLPNEREM
jgi:hypothetical protein